MIVYLIVCKSQPPQVAVEKVRSGSSSETVEAEQRVDDKKDGVEEARTPHTGVFDYHRRNEILTRNSTAAIEIWSLLP